MSYKRPACRAEEFAAGTAAAQCHKSSALLDIAGSHLMPTVRFVDIMTFFCMLHWGGPQISLILPRGWDTRYRSRARKPHARMCHCPGSGNHDLTWALQWYQNQQRNRFVDKVYRERLNSLLSSGAITGFAIIWYKQSVAYQARPSSEIMQYGIAPQRKLGYIMKSKLSSEYSSFRQICYWKCETSIDNAKIKEIWLWKAHVYIHMGFISLKDFDMVSRLCSLFCYRIPCSSFYFARLEIFIFR